jgi:hypothetical protein
MTSVFLHSRYPSLSVGALGRGAIIDNRTIGVMATSEIGSAERVEYNQPWQNKETFASYSFIAPIVAFGLSR